MEHCYFTFAPARSNFFLFLCKCTVITNYFRWCLTFRLTITILQILSNYEFSSYKKIQELGSQTNKFHFQLIDSLKQVPLKQILVFTTYGYTRCQHYSDDFNTHMNKFWRPTMYMHIHFAQMRVLPRRSSRFSTSSRTCIIFLCLLYF
jgi:hypothetical protein